MQKETLTIPSISCNHCVAAIESELKTLPGILRVTGNAATKQVEILWEAPTSLDQIRAMLIGINYPAE